MEWLGDNQFFQGGLSLMLVAAGGVALRYLPQLAWDLIWRWFGVVTTVRDQTMVRWMGIWLAEGEWGRKQRWLEVATNDRKDGLEAVMRPGPGLHTFTFKGRRFYLNHDLEDAGIAGKISVLTLRILRPERGLIGGLIQEVVDRANRERIGKTAVFVNSRAYWELVRLTEKREASTVFLKPGLLQQVFDDADWFFGAKDWYRQRGLPYRRGYLLSGPPGNGKSTLIQALAAHCGVSIYSLTLTDKEFTEPHLVSALGNVPEQSIVVVEDIEKVDLSRTQITQSGLLNAIDSALASEARILIATANDVSGLLPALLRPGRIDRRWEIANPGVEAVATCIAKFSVDGAGPAIAEMAMAGGWSMARLQSELAVLGHPSRTEVAGDRG
jgi:chaperone BCS1